MKQKFMNLGSTLSKEDAKRIVGSSGGGSGCMEQCMQNTSTCNFFHYCDWLVNENGDRGCHLNPSLCCDIYCNSELPY